MRQLVRVVSPILGLVLGVFAAQAAADDGKGGEGDERILASIMFEHRLEVYDASGNVVARIPTGIEPRGMIAHRDQIIVANRGRNALPGSSLTIVDRETLIPERTVLACMACGPSQLLVLEDDTLLVLGQIDRTIVRIPAPYREPTGSALLSWAWPSRMMALGAAGRVVVGMRGGDEIAVVDMSQDKPSWTRRAIAASPTSVLRRPGSDSVWVVTERGRIAEVSPAALEDPDAEVETMKAPTVILDAAWDVRGQRLYVASGSREAIIAIDPDTGEEVSEFRTTSAPHLLERSPDGSRLAAGLTEGKILILRVAADGSLGLDREWNTPGPVGDILWLDAANGGE